MTQPLITRLSKLEGPDREVDAQIEVAVRRIEAARSGLAEEYWANWQASPDGTVYDPHTRYSSNPFTASVDAVIALARRLYPDVMYRVGNDGEGPDPSLYLGEIFIPGEQKDSYFTGVSPVDAASLCIALLRVKEASK
ncbi:hypothetical protein [Brucella intermedia]|uniref:hypothetical protein n=1 Tax=Brucella intermedia TaxID=94625 RepID=UPI00124D3063|nr:hypothetical protein [Brucella intermedia]KAB2708294.1 hypothetical protein F9K80_14440 [Brucella intermedia]